MPQLTKLRTEPNRDTVEETSPYATPNKNRPLELKKFSDIDPNFMESPKRFDRGKDDKNT